MAYPFLPMPTFKEFVEAAGQQFDCKFVVKNKGAPFPVKYFERSINGKNKKCATAFEDENEVMTPQLVRSLLRCLEIDPKLFGFHLD